nr:MAG TPA: hypothetical protein [Caudoviricetes sp.]
MLSWSNGYAVTHHILKLKETLRPSPAFHTNFSPEMYVLAYGAKAPAPV